MLRVVIPAFLSTVLVFELLKPGTFSPHSPTPAVPACSSNQLPLPFGPFDPAHVLQGAPGLLTAAGRVWSTSVAVCRSKGSKVWEHDFVGICRNRSEISEPV